jgi:acyl dehydratase
VPTSDEPAGSPHPPGAPLDRGGRLRVGQTAQRRLTVTAEHVAGYARLTGDFNPLHFDEGYAARTRFGRLVAQGGLTTGLLHALVAMDLPGPGTVFLSQNWKFTAPVYIGDTITAHAEVVRVHPTKPVCQLRVRVARQTGETVLEGEAWCYTLRPGGPDGQR